MQKKYIHLILLFAVVILLLPFAQTTLALEVKYPNLPFGNITPNNNLPSLPQYIAYFFYFFISVSGIIGVIAIVIAGFEFLISAGNEALITEAKDRIRSAVFGIILLMCTFILVKTINPELINLRANPQTGTFDLPSGVYETLPGGAQPPGTWTVGQSNYNIIGIPYARAHDEDQEEEESDYFDDFDYMDKQTGTRYYRTNGLDPDTLEDQIPDITGKLIYFKCNREEEKKGIIATFQVYHKDDFEEESSTVTLDLGCGEVIPAGPEANILSYKWKIRDSGIYLYSKSGCEGDSSYDGITFSQDIPRDFLDLKSLKIINSADNENPEDDVYWGLAMNAASGGRGESSQPAINITKENICVEVSTTLKPQYMTVFEWDWDYDNNKKGGYQNGITLYGMPVEIEAPPADTGDPGDPGNPPNDPGGSGGEEGDAEEPANEQDYYYIGADKVQNHWYYVQEGYAEHKAGYFTQSYYNISRQQIRDKINQNGKGYYTCFNDPGVLLKKHEEGVDPCDAGSGSGGDNVCVVDDPGTEGTEATCLVPNSPYCIQSIILRPGAGGGYLIMVYNHNENDDNRTVLISTEDVLDLQSEELTQNGKAAYRLNIIPIKKR